MMTRSTTRKFAALADDPFACCVLLECEHGGGSKTSAALAFTREIGCEDEWTGLHVVPFSEFTVDVARKMFGGNGSAPVLRLQTLQGRG